MSRFMKMILKTLLSNIQLVLFKLNVDEIIEVYYEKKIAMVLIFNRKKFLQRFFDGF